KVSPVPSAAGTSAQDEFAYDAFISYNEQDSHWVETILQPRLEGAGLRLCLPDRDFAIGAPRIVNMEKAVARSRKTLLILTPNWGRRRGVGVGGAAGAGRRPDRQPPAGAAGDSAARPTAGAAGLSDAARPDQRRQVRAPDAAADRHHPSRSGDCPGARANLRA